MSTSSYYIYGIYDGDGSASSPGPPGSADIEAKYERWFASKRLPSIPTEFDGRSDYGPFIAAGDLFR